MMNDMQAQWEFHRKVLEDLYLRDDKPLKEIINYMKENHDFQASKAQYELQFKKWKLRKNLSKREWEFVHQRIQKRELEGKESETYFNDTLIPSKKIKKETSRYNPPTFHQGYASAPSPQTPEGISICTPSAEAFEAHPNMLENLPWLQFIDFVDAQVSIGLVPEPPTALGNYIPPKALFLLLPGSSTLSLTANNTEIVSKILPQLQATFFERYDGELMRSIHSTLEPNSGVALTELLKFAVYLVSNNLSTEPQKDGFLRWIIECGRQSILRSFLAVKMPMTYAFAQNIFPSALEIGDVQLVQMLVDAGVPLNRSVNHHGTPLFIAVKHRNIALIRTLLVGGANVNEQNEKGEYLALHQAVQDGRVDILQLLLSFGADINAHKSSSLLGKGRTLLHEAVGFDRYIEIVQLLLASGFVVNKKSDDGRSALHEAAEYGRIEVIPLLLSFGANLEDETEDGKTALHEAVFYDKIGAVRILLNSGSNVNAEDRDGRTALYQAALQNSFDIASLLLNSGSNRNAKARDGTTALEASIRGGNTEIIQLLSQLNTHSPSHLPLLIDDIAKLHQLQRAVIEEDEKMVRDLLQIGVEVNNSTYHSDSLLEIALENRNVRITRLLVKAGANVNGSHKEGNSCRRSPLRHAVRNLFYVLDTIYSDIRDSLVFECMEIVRLLLDGGAEVNDFSHPRIDCDCMTPFQDAVVTSNLELVKLLLANGTDVNEPAAGRGGRTALQYALKTTNTAGSMELIELLLDSGADLSAPAASRDGIATIHAAAGYGDIRIMTLILRAGVDVNTPAECCEGGRTALQAAVENGKVEMTRFLLSMGADVNAPGSCKDGKTALHAAVTAKDETLALTSLLLRAGANIDALDNNKHGTTALQAAAATGHVDVVQLLLKHGATVNAPACQDHGRTALQAAAAASTGDANLVKLLLNASADVNANAAPFGGLTALQGAAIKGHLGIAILLLESGADVNAPAANSEGRTALEGAAEHGRIDMIRLLLNAGADSAKLDEDRYSSAIRLAERNRQLAAAAFLRGFLKR